MPPNLGTALLAGAPGPGPALFAGADRGTLGRIRRPLLQSGGPELHLVDAMPENLQLGLVGEPPLGRPSQPW